MKTLYEIEDSIKKLKNEIFCHEIGNDMYFTSPLYHEHLLKLNALENEAQVLKGKSAPIQIDFKGLCPQQSEFLQGLAEQNGIWFADSYQNLNAGDLDLIISDEKQDKFRK